MFTHHPDNYILINGENFPMSFFKTAEPNYNLHSDWKGRIYIPNQKHILLGNNGEVSLGETWEEGDVYISKLDYYKAAYEAHVEKANWTSDINGINEDIQEEN